MGLSPDQWVKLVDYFVGYKWMGNHLDIANIMEMDDPSIVYLTVPKKKSKNKRLPFKEIEEITYIPLEGKEKGVIHYLFNKKLIRKILNWWPGSMITKTSSYLLKVFFPYCQFYFTPLFVG